MTDIGRPNPPIGTRRHRDRTKAPLPHPATAVPAPNWVGTDDDTAWLQVREEIRSFKRMKDLKRSVQECQVAVAHLASFGDGPGPVGQAALRAMQSLALDVHNECRGLVASEVHHASRAHGHRRLGPLVSWVLSPVGSGSTGGPVDYGVVRRSYRAAVLIRMAGAVASGVALVAGHPLVAIVVLLASVTTSGYRRYRDHLEPVVTFRARYLSCLIGHFGDIVVLGASTYWLWHIGAAWWPAPAAMAVMLFSTIVRTGALQVGVFVPRIRVDRVVRIVAFCGGIALVTFWLPAGFGATLALLSALGAFETFRILREVWSAGVTEVAWMSSTPSGYVSSMLIGPLPQTPDTKEAP